MSLQRFWCFLGVHPSDSTERHTVGNADEYGHYECHDCGRRWGHWDYT